MGLRATEVFTSTGSTEIAGGGVAWVNPQYASVEDGVNFANITFAGFDLSNWINALTFATWPPLAVYPTRITGVMVSVYIMADIPDVARITHAQLTVSGAQVAFSNDLDCPKPIKDAFEWKDIGGDGEMWGLTESQIRTWINSKFQGFRFEVEEETGATPVVDVDGMKITVYWDEYHVRNLTGCGR